MAHNNVEIEIKVRVEDVGPLLSFLGKEGKFKGELEQVDEYFTPKHLNYLSTYPVTEWLRLRQTNGNKFTINYKNFHIDADGKTRSCDELETEVENIEQMKLIFKALEIKSIAKVDKLRKVWVYEEYEIAIDEVKGLGNFVEVEYLAQSDDPKRTTDKMMDFLKSLKLGKIERSYQGYPFLLLFPERSDFAEE